MSEPADRPDVIINLPQPLDVVARILKAMPKGAYLRTDDTGDPQQMRIWFPRTPVRRGGDEGGNA